jgi:hypothetical protein
VESGKWENGKMGKWENGKMGEWENGRMGWTTSVDKEQKKRRDLAQKTMARYETGMTTDWPDRCAPGFNTV